MLCRCGVAAPRAASALSTHRWSRLYLCKRRLGVPSNGQRRLGSSNASYELVVEPEVQRAIAAGLPIVALESTVITHGLPWPQNLEMAKLVEGAVRERGAVPATIAIVGGRPRVGLNHADLESLARSSTALKISARDIGFCIAQGCDGGTTVAGSITLASKAGITVFATGGLGGVHRGGENSMDVSADLVALSKTPVICVCAGIKSILDIGRSLEFLETQGVPVVALGCEEFPAFFSTASGVRAPRSATSTLQIAQAFQASAGLHGSGMVVAVPPPPGMIGGDEIESAIQHALQHAETEGIQGAGVTPAVLSKVHEITGGRSVDLNMALLHHNAVVAADIAVHLSQPVAQAPDAQKVFIVGGAVVDWLAVPHHKIVPHSSTPGKLRQSFGGVGRNVAEILARLGSSPSLLSAVADDALGHALVAACKDCGVDVSPVVWLKEGATASYLAIADEDGDLHCAIADMDALELVDTNAIKKCRDSIAGSRMVVADCNPTTLTLRSLSRLCEELDVPFIVEPTSAPKSRRLMAPDVIAHVDLITPNALELREMAGCIAASGNVEYIGGDCPKDLLDHISDCGTLLRAMHGNSSTSGGGGSSGRICKETGAKHVVLTLGDRGALLVSSVSPPATTGGLLQVQATAFAPLQVPSHLIANTSGAGDALLAGLVHGLCEGWSVEESIPIGMICASEALTSHVSVPASLSKEIVNSKLADNVS
jgi:pseudouridine-5'-phosphate glycosidase/pseudouridine kinase